MSEGRRTFLFLQGPSSPIFARIADHLETRGHRVLRINICAGDRVFWRRAGAVNYRGTLADWGGFVDDFMRREGVTDLVMLGEERPFHRVATETARRLGVEPYNIEMGYLRPYWLTIERGGAGCNSHFPADPGHILKAGAHLPEPERGVRLKHAFIAEVAYDLAYNLPNVFLWFLHPHYRWHALFHPLHEYYGWVLRMTRARSRRRHAEAVLERLKAERLRYFLFPLQLQTDYQLRVHSPFTDQQQAIAGVIRSFAAHAPASRHLVIKVHPLDNGLIDWRGFAEEQARAAGVSERVHYIDGGDLSTLIGGSEGVVTINSTVGIQSLVQRRPTKALGTAIYDIPGLTDGRELAAFWNGPDRGSDALRSAFLKLLAASMQVRGGFYSHAGIEAGAAAIADRLDRRLVNEPDGYVDVPPRPRPLKIGEPGATDPTA